MSARPITRDTNGNPIIGIALAAPFDIDIGPIDSRWRVMGKCAAGSATTALAEQMADGIELVGVYPDDVNSDVAAVPLTIGVGDFSSKVFDRFLSQVLQGSKGANRIVLRITPTALDLTALYVDVLDYHGS